MRSSIAALVLVSLFSSASSSPPAALGPPIVCHELAIDGARSLPWRKGLEPDPSYDRRRVVEDTAEILKTETRLVVRMETLRRAAVLCRQDRALAWELLGRTGLMALEQEALAAKSSTAWFDVGVVVACLDQLDVDVGFRAGVAEGFDGYGYFTKALSAAAAEGNQQVATIEFAAALCAHPGMRKGGGDARDRERFLRHVEAARAGANAAPLLANNLATHGALQGYERGSR